MYDFASAHAAGGSPEAIAETLAAQLHGNGHTVGFIYATSSLSPDFGRLLTALRRRTGIDNWVGTVGHGVCASGIEHWGQPAAVVLTCRFARDSYRLIGSITDAGSVARRPEPGFAAGLGVVHGDPRNGQVVEIVADLARTHGAYLVGGLTSADSAFPQVAGQQVVDGGVSGILLGGRLVVAMGLTQGCTPIGPVHEVTAGQGQVLIQLDGRRAWDVLMEDIGIAEGADPRPWLANVHAAMPIAGSQVAGSRVAGVGDADYVVRNLVGIDAGRGIVAIAAGAQPGDRIMFVRRDADSAAKDLERMLGDLKGRLSGRARAGLYYSCVGRGPNLFERKAYELATIREALGDIPLAGFFGNGEISQDRVYGYTGVLTLFA